MDTKLRLSHFNPNNNKCVITQQQTPKDSYPDPDSDSAFVRLAAIASLSALALTIPLSLLLVSLLRRYTHPLLLLFAPFMSLVFLGVGLLWFLGIGLFCLWDSEVCATVHVSTHITSALYLPGVSALLAYPLWKNWTGSSVENGVEVLRMATGFWKEHFVLLVVNPLLLIGAMVVVNGPIFTFMWYAFNVGEIVPDFDVVNDPIKGCELATGSPCCREERPGWVYAYITFASFTAFWVLMVSIVLQHLVVSRLSRSGTLPPLALPPLATSSATGVYGVLEYFANAYFVTKSEITLLCFVVTMMGLGPGFSEAIFSVITTVSVCYSIERDVGEISKPEVCHVFMIIAPSLPENGAKLQDG